jgi:hypothetical protein
MRLLWIAIMLFAPGCIAQVGDACETNVECGQALFCDLSQPSGYCTVTPCEIGECPKDSACIRFDDDSTYCMQRCEDSDDCRDDYVCVGNFGDVPFCNSVTYLDD